MRIAIAGSGTTGAYCYRLLWNAGFHPDVYDKRPKTTCGINPCAWGTSRGFKELIRAVDLDPEDYVLRRFGALLINEVGIKGELMTIDKPALIQDLLRGARISREPLIPARYDRVIDATGIARAYLPPIHKDILLPCIQHRIETEENLQNRIKLGGIGYAWCFPLGNHAYHVGCGSLTTDPKALLKRLGWLGDGSASAERQIHCTCSGSIRLSGPHDALPFVADGSADGIWGIGEAIGCVAPLAGDGIVPGMKSVELLLKCWDDPLAYRGAILKEFDWMKREREVINKLMVANPLGVKEAWVLKKNSRRMGMHLGIKEAFLLLKALM